MKYIYDITKGLIACTGNPECAHTDMARLARAFFMPEHVDLAAAMAIVKKPR